LPHRMGIIQSMSGQRSISLLLFLFANSIGVPIGAQTPRVSPAGVDSLVLERTPCYGTCPAYRLSITQLGRVSFASRNLGEAERSMRDSISGQRFTDLLSLADRLGFDILPDSIAADPALCPDRATDHPTAIVTIFKGGHRKAVVDYHGCFAAVDHSEVPALSRLRNFEAMIDSVAGSARWVRSAGRR
jgi:hypothetical protein